MRYPDVTAELVDLLADKEPGARHGAVRALALKGNAEAVALLRFKALVGDEDPQVVGECLSGLVDAEATDALPFLERLLKTDDEPTQEAAALALGASRLEEAFPILRAWVEGDDSAEGSVTGRLRPHGELVRVALIAIASLRRDSAFEYLLEQVHEATPPTAEAALGALEIYLDDKRSVARICRTAKEREGIAIPEGVQAALAAET